MASRIHSGTVIAAIVLSAMIAGLVYRYSPGEERSVRRHISNLAEALSFPSAENEVQRLTRFQALREYFVPDVRIRVDGEEIQSSEALVALLGQVRPPPAGIVVEFGDVVVALAEDEATAAVTLTARVSTTDPATGRRTVDARKAALTMTRRPGDWMIATAETRD